MEYLHRLILTAARQVKIKFMDIQIGKDIENRERRIDFLKTNCDSVEKKGYMKRFTPEQLQQMKEELSETAIEINDIQEEKKEIMAHFKVKLKPLSEEKKELLSGLKNKAKYISEECFKFIDIEEREVGYYNEDGDLIESRPAYADELQRNIFQINRTGTNDK